MSATDVTKAKEIAIRKLFEECNLSKKCQHKHAICTDLIVVLIGYELDTAHPFAFAHYMRRGCIMSTIKKTVFKDLVKSSHQAFGKDWDRCTDESEAPFKGVKCLVGIHLTPYGRVKLAQMHAELGDYPGSSAVSKLGESYFTPTKKRPADEMEGSTCSDVPLSKRLKTKNAGGVTSLRAELDKFQEFTLEVIRKIQDDNKARFDAIEQQLKDLARDNSLLNHQLSVVKDGFVDVVKNDVIEDLRAELDLIKAEMNTDSDDDCDSGAGGAGDGDGAVGDKPMTMEERIQAWNAKVGM